MAEAKKTTTKKTVKATEVKDLATLRNDLDAKLQDLLTSRKSHRAGELVNPRILGTIRKEIARLNTAIRAAEQVAKESK